MNTVLKFELQKPYKEKAITKQKSEYFINIECFADSIKAIFKKNSLCWTQINIFIII